VIPPWLLFILIIPQLTIEDKRTLDKLRQESIIGIYPKREVDRMIIACATDDGKAFISRHFGDAKRFDLYKLEEGQLVFLKSVYNTTEPDNEEVHGDPVKAGGIVGLLKEQEVRVVVSMVFGPNIKRIVRHFLPIVMPIDSITEGLKSLKENQKRIEKLVEDNKKNIYINLKNNSEVEINER